MSDDGFNRLLKCMTERFDALDKKLDEKADKSDMKIMLDKIVSLVKRLETQDQERLAMGHQIGRLDGWTHELADKIGHKLSA